MNSNSNRRGQHRRYSDRRVAALLELYEILFYETDDTIRNHRLMVAMREDYQVDRCCLAFSDSSDAGVLNVLCCSTDNPPQNLHGSGLSKIIEIHNDFDGALTLSRFRKSAQFSKDEWNALWENDLGQASALLTVPVATRNNRSGYLLLVIDAASREWSSHDRDLAEEEAMVFAHMINRGTLPVE